MNLPIRIANQYLFTDRFFSRRGLLLNGIVSAVVLLLMLLDIRWGIPLLIVQLLPFEIIKDRPLLDWGAKLALAYCSVFSEDILRYVILLFALIPIILEIRARRRPSWLSILLLIIYGAVLFYDLWFGVMFYLLSLFALQLIKGKRNAVHVISRISVLGIAVGTTALILVLSVFNGFEDLIINLFDAFNPDVKITAQKGKVFTPDSTQITALQNLEEVQNVSQTLQEVAFFEYEGSQDFGIIKGVDENFQAVSNLDSSIIRGFYALRKESTNYAIVGSGMEYKLGVNVENRFNSLNIYMPKRKPSSIPFKTRLAYPIGTFAIQQDFDDQFIITHLDLARDLLSYQNEISALEVQLAPNTTYQAIAKIKAIMGDEYVVRNRYQQNEAFFKLMNIEKWIGFAVLAFTLLLVSFNMVGALWMLVLEKKKDIAILKAMGTLNSTIQRIFINKGLLLSLLGGLVGIYIALIFYFFQQQVELVKLAGSANLLVDSYPISLKWLDFALVFITIALIGVLAAWLPAWRAKRIPALIREE